MPELPKTNDFLSAPTADCCSDSGETWTQKLSKVDFSSCLEKICGKPDEVLNQTTYFDKLRQTAAKNEGEIRKKFQPMLQKWRDALKKSALQDIGEQIAYFEKGEGLKSQSLKNFYGFIVLASHMKDIKMREIKEEAKIPRKADGSIDYISLIDREKTAEALKKLNFTSEELNGVFDFIKAIMGEAIEIEVQNEQWKKHEEGFLILKHKKKFREALLAELKENEVASEKTSKELASYFGVEFPKNAMEFDRARSSTLMDLIRASGGVPLNLIQQLLEDNTKNNILSLALVELKKTPLNPALMKFAAEDRSKDIPFILKSLKRQKVLIESPDFNDTTTAAMDLCLSDLSMATASYPQKAQKDELLSRFKNGVSRFNEKFKDILSPATLETFSKKMAHMDIVTPPTQDEWLAFVQKYFETNLKEVEESQMQDDMKHKLPDYKWLSTTDTLFPSETDDQNDVVREIRKACQFYQVEPPIRDYNLYTHDTIVLSAFSTMDNTIASWIASHEVGHSLNQLFKTKQASEHSAKWYGSAQGCMEAWHPESVERKTSYFDEDFSDEVANRLSPGATPSSCALTATWDSKYVAGESDETAFSKPSFLNKNKTDVHSSSVFRVLHSYWNSHHDFPAECKASLKQSGLEPALKDCF